MKLTRLCMNPRAQSGLEHTGWPPSEHHTPPPRPLVPHPMTPLTPHTHPHPPVQQAKLAYRTQFISTHVHTKH